MVEKDAIETQRASKASWSTRATTRTPQRLFGPTSANVSADSSSDGGNDVFYDCYEDPDSEPANISSDDSEAEPSNDENDGCATSKIELPHPALEGCSNVHGRVLTVVNVLQMQNRVAKTGVGSVSTTKSFVAALSPPHPNCCSQDGAVLSHSRYTRN